MTPLQQLIRGIEKSLGAESPEDITKRIASVAQEVCNSCGDMLEGTSIVDGPTSYARNLLHKDPEGRFTVIAMSWSPGQGTPLHDHDGKWGVEITCRGTIECTDYSVERCPETGNWNCEPGETFVQAPGEVGRILPDEGYHTMINTSSDPALTIHIYQDELTECTIFTPCDSSETYVKERLTLGYDNVG